MRTLCDSFESAAAFVFCAADEAALCLACDDKVHMCNKLASRHIRVGLADSSDVPRCDICEHAPAFFYCEIDGTSLCQQCDLNVHVRGKRAHARYLVLRQRVQFQGNKLDITENQQNNNVSPVSASNANSDHRRSKADSKLIDLNMKPNRLHEQNYP